MTARAAFAALLAVALPVVACGPAPPPAAESEPRDSPGLVVLTDVGEAAVAPQIAAWEAAAGVPVEVRHGAIGPGSRDDGVSVLLARRAADLVALAAGGELVPLPLRVVSRVPPPFTGGREGQRQWVGVGARLRAMLFATERLAAEDLPASLGGLAEPRFADRLVVAPGEDGFLRHLAAYRTREGETALEALAAALAGADVQRVADGSAVVAAVAAGQSDLGVLDHPEAITAQAERGDLGVAFFAGEEGRSGLAFSAVALAQDGEPARRLLEHLLSVEGQSDWAASTGEIPLAAGTASPEGLPQLGSLAPPVPVAEVAAALDPTRELLRRHGLTASGGER